MKNKKLCYMLVLACTIVFAASCDPKIEDPQTPPDQDTTKVDTTRVLTEWEIADTTYTVRDYTVPSHTAFKIALTACATSPSEENLQAMRQKIQELVPKTEPYCMVATINGDPKTHMGFCWFTNDGITEGEVQLVAKADATEADFAGSVITIPATTKRTEAMRYCGICKYIVAMSGIAKNTKYTYISHKALAENLTPGTDYSWRVGYEGHWSPIAQFRTQDENQGEFSFVYIVIL